LAESTALTEGKPAIRKPAMTYISVSLGLYCPYRSNYL
jgi:hypothetical protein